LTDSTDTTLSFRLYNNSTAKRSLAVELLYNCLCCTNAYVLCSAKTRPAFTKWL